MSGDLVKRLRLGACDLDIDKAADIIEELEAKLATAGSFLSKLDRHGVYTANELEDLLDELKADQ